MLVMVILTVFIAGLMVGRTPEYLGKRIQAREVQMAMLYVLVFPAIILGLTAVSAVLPAGLEGLNNSGPHGLSEILYAFSSTTGNNGSAFAGLTGSTYYYNTLFGAAMLVGRFAMIVPMVALGGFLSERRIAPETAGTFPVTTPLFVVLLVGVILIVGALTFFPCPRPGADRGAFPHAGGEALLAMSARSIPSSIRPSCAAPCGSRCTSSTRGTWCGIR